MPVPTPAELGPLAGLAGTWEGDQGLDISYHHAEGEIGETKYREKVEFKPFGPVDNGTQSLFGLDYRMAAYKEGEDEPFHTEVGYWLWDADNKQVMRCFMVPRGQVVIAGGSANADSKTLEMSAKNGSNTYGILSNQYLEANSKTPEYSCTITVGDGEWSYTETTVYEVKSKGLIVQHTDRNTLKKVG
ncbi:MAG: hypothetical protein RLZZ31_1816 [Actinomycetota bacterium]